VYVCVYVYKEQHFQFLAYFSYFQKVKEVLGITNRLLSLIWHGPHWKRRVQNLYVVACVFVSAVTFLPSRCLATIGEFFPSRCQATIRGSLPSRCLTTIRGIHRHTHTPTATWFLKKKVKLSLEQAVIPMGLWDVEAPKFSRQLGHRWRWGCHKPTLFFKIRKVDWKGSLWTHFAVWLSVRLCVYVSP
jgi:hypothetical protein